MAVNPFKVGDIVLHQGIKWQILKLGNDIADIDYQSNETITFTPIEVNKHFQIGMNYWTYTYQDVKLFSRKQKSTIPWL